MKKESAILLEKDNLKTISEWLNQEKICGDAQSGRRTFVSYYGGTLQFRFPDKLVADFYPRKNKWRNGSNIYYGDATKFLEWYEKQ